jgi:hypothetical protein
MEFFLLIIYGCFSNRHYEGSRVQAVICRSLASESRVSPRVVRVRFLKDEQSCTVAALSLSISDFPSHSLSRQCSTFV